MKSRIGFVSNSSTSSFILAGIDIKYLPEEMRSEDFLEEHDLWQPPEADIVGVLIRRYSDGEIVKIDLLKLATAIDEARETFKKIGVNKEPEIYSGIYAN